METEISPEILKFVENNPQIPHLYPQETLRNPLERGMILE